MSFVEGNISVGIELAPGTLDRLKANLSNIEKGLSLKVNIDPSPLQKTSRATDELGQSASNAASTISNKLGGAVKTAGLAVGALGLAGAASIIALGTKAIQAGKEFNILQQQVRAGLTAVLGTSSAAEQLLAQVNKLNDTSPFPRSAFLSATQQLVGFGVSAEKVVPILDAIQQAAAGVGGDANDIANFTRAFAQIQSQGRLTGDILLTLGSRGIDAAEIIGKQMGRTGQDIKADISAGVIGASQSIDLLTKGLQEKFKGATENVAKNFAGASQRVQARLRDIGASLTSVFITPTGGGAAVTILNNVANVLSFINKKIIPELQPAIKSVADVLVKASNAASDFVKGLSSAQIQHFLDILKSILPIIAVFASKFAGSIVSQIPILQKFGGALGGPVVAIGLLVATVPQLRQVFLGLVQALTPLVQALLPVMQSVLNEVKGVLVAITPILGVVVSAISALVSVITPVINALQKLGIAGPILTLIIGKLLLMKLASNESFGNLTKGIQNFGNTLQGVGSKAASSLAGIGLNAKIAVQSSETIGGKLKGLGSVGKDAIGGIGSALGGLVTPANAALVGITLITTGLANADAHAQKLVETVGQGLDFGNTKDIEVGLKRVNSLIDENAKKVKKASIFDRAGSFFPGASHNAINAARAGKPLAKERDDLLTKQAIGKNINEAVIAKTGLSAEVVAEKVKKMNLTLTEIPGDKVDSTIKSITEALTGAAAQTERVQQNFQALSDLAGKSDAAQASIIATRDAQRSLDEVRRSSATRAIAVRDAERGLASARIALDRFTQEVADDERNLTRARENQVDAANRLVDAEHKRNLVLADTGAGDREVADAAEALFNTRSRLRDLDQEEESVLRDLVKTQSEASDKLASADRSVERAKIALNRATREEQDLLKQSALAKLANVNLSGLSIDEIRNKLANTRASLDSLAVTSQQVEEEQQNKITEAHLNTLDAAQGIKDATQSRLDLQIEINTKVREDGERLKAIQVEREDGNRRLTEQQNTLNDLSAGFTQHAREVRDVSIEVRDAQRGTADAAIAVRDASITLSDKLREQPGLVDAVKSAQIQLNDKVREQKQLTSDIKDAQDKLKQAIIDQHTKMAELIGDHKTVNKLLTDRILINASLLNGGTAEQSQAAKVQLANSLPALLTGAVGISNGIPVDVTKLPASFVQNIADQLINSPGNDVLRILKILLNQSGLKIPGLAQGAVVNSETIARIGEAGREVVLPLTRPARLAELLSNQQVLPPVLAALQRIHLPDPISHTPQNFGSNFNLEQIGIRPGSGGNVITADHWEYDVLSELRGLREDLSKLDAGTTQFSIEVKETDQDVLTRKMRREIERMIAERRR